MKGKLLMEHFCSETYLAFAKLLSCTPFYGIRLYRKTTEEFNDVRKSPCLSFPGQQWIAPSVVYRLLSVAISFAFIAFVRTFSMKNNS